MIRNYFKIAWRNLIKNKIYSLINIGGLAIGISAYLLIMQYVNFESGYDQHQPRIDDLYRVTLTTDLGSKGFQTSAANHPTVGVAMKQDFPEVETFARLVDRSIMWGSFLLTYTNEQGNLIKSNVTDDAMFLADSTTLDLFNIPLIKGTPNTALTEPRSIILSSDVAQRFFGTQDPINKSLMVNNWFSLKVTGVFEKLPENTHLKFDMLISMSSLGPRRLESWMHPVFYNYIRLKSGTDPVMIEDKFPAFVKKYLGDIMKEHGFEAEFRLQPVKDIHLKSNYINEIATNANEKTLHFLQIIAVFVILIALMNFINLSTAKSTERALEVGLKKVVGIKKSTLIGQFLFESLAINLIAAMIAIILVSGLINPFNQMVGLQILSLDMWFQPEIWIQLLTLILLGGILAGAYPAFVLSSFKPVQVLKGNFHQSGKGYLIRKALVVAQFTISIALISGIFIIYNQFSFMQDKELGFDARHNLVVYAPKIIDSTFNHKLKVFKDELARNPNINRITLTNEIPGNKMRWGSVTRQLHEKKEEAIPCSLLSIDIDFIETFRIKLLAGRNFRLEEHTHYNVRELYDSIKSHRVLINKAAVHELGFTNIEDALNKKIFFKFGNGDHPAEVIGVLDNYHQQSLQNNYKPIIFMNPIGYYDRYLTLNINATNMQNTIQHIGKKYEELFPKDPYKYFFLDEYFNRQYQADLKFGQIFLLFAGLAIFIAALGLFGLGSYMALKKSKESCIRKVLGANIVQILVLIPKSLLILVLISGFIALPITYFLASEWLSNYAFRITINLWMFVAPLSLVILVAALSVLPESLKVALLKPSKYLRSE